MTPENLKLLNALAYPGRCWHDVTYDSPDGHVQCKCSCGKIWALYSPQGLKHFNPTFTTEKEMIDVMKGLQRERLWNSFILSAKRSYPKHKITVVDAEFILWLFSDVNRFMQLVCECEKVKEWWEVRK